MIGSGGVVEVRLSSGKWTGQKELLLFLLYPGILPDQINPLLGILQSRSLEMEVLCGRKQAKDVWAFLLWVFEEGDGRQIRQVDFVSKFLLLI